MMHKFNYGPNVKWFGLSSKVLYVSSWCVVGMVFSTNIEKSKIVKLMLVEYEIKREQFINDEFNKQVLQAPSPDV